jgi:hypothetical protein
MGIQQLSTRLLLRNTPRINIPLRCTANVTAADESSSSIATATDAHTRSNVKVVKTEENEDTMTQHHDDKSNLEQQQQGQLSTKKKACTNNSVSVAAAAVNNFNKKAKKMTMKSKEKTKKSSKKCSVNFNETVTVIPIPTKEEYSNRIKSKLWTNKYEMMERIGKYMHVCLCFLPPCHHYLLTNICLLFFFHHHQIPLRRSAYPPTQQVRNELEFATEGYNWRSVCTEEEMYIYYINNNNVEDYDNAAIIVGGSTATAKSYELIHPVHFDLGEYTFGMGGQVIKLSSDHLCNC